ncbi:MAG: molybdopterin molybdotransferase MoeA [Pseudomonadales bacterium]|nr:molybdopterin molybdotransferase MoeA [Pseudomonadales bacterium]
MGGTPLTPVDVAIEQLLAAADGAPAVQPGATLDALGRVLARDLHAPFDQPAVDNSAVDGYAVRSREVEAGRPLPISQRIAAGDVAAELVPGTVARIFTGAPLPAGADAVVMQEDADPEADQVRFTVTPRPGANVRRRGHEIAAGSLLLPAGTRLRPQELGLIASAGVAQIPLCRPLRVALLSTGRELLEPGQGGAEQLASGTRMFNSNRYLLTGLLRGLGCQIDDFGIVDDTLAATRAALQQAAAVADLLITTGGASVGEEDHLISAIQQLGRLKLWQLAIKPGKPFAFGEIGTTPIMALPGNPAAVLVTFCILCRPYLLRRQGVREVAPLRVGVPAGFSVSQPGKRREYLRARLLRDATGHDRLEPHPNQGSGVLRSAAWADGLAVVEPGQRVTAGDLIDFHPFAALLG